MSLKRRYVSSILQAVLLLSPVVFSGCAARVTYRAYDPEYRDYHAWDGVELGFYQNWESETHRDHRDFRKRNREEQKEYFEWRHHHDDKHHDDRHDDKR
jgi:hypothetical protein